MTCKRMMGLLFWSAVVFGLLSPPPTGAQIIEPEEPIIRFLGNNVVLIVADDVGVDSLAAYGEGSDFPSTPNIDNLRNDGLLFRNVWSNPLCSPTRATILSGRYGFRTGVGFVTPGGNNPNNALPLSETIIPEMLDLALVLPRVQHAAFGKWHVSNDSNGGALGPNLAGYSHYAGALANIGNYFSWPRTVDGITETCVEGGAVPECEVDPYATSINVDDAMDWVQAQGLRPWFVHLAFNAAHSPFQAPPDDLHGVNLPVPEGQNCPFPDRRPCYVAMIEAMDAEIGRFLASLSPFVRQRTTVIFMGDNGTPRMVTAPPFISSHAKGTLYEGGINVPLIITGPEVANPGGESAALVNTTDLFVTILAAALGRLPLANPSVGADSRSLLPILRGDASSVRDEAFAEIFRPFASPADGKTIRNVQYKLIRFDLNAREEFYDLLVDPFEQNDLLLLPSLTPTEQANLDRLRFRLDELLAS